MQPASLGVSATFDNLSSTLLEAGWGPNSLLKLGFRMCTFVKFSSSVNTRSMHVEIVSTLAVWGVTQTQHRYTLCRTSLTQLLPVKAAHLLFVEKTQILHNSPVAKNHFMFWTHLKTNWERTKASLTFRSGQRPIWVKISVLWCKLHSLQSCMTSVCLIRGVTLKCLCVTHRAGSVPVRCLS